MKYILILTLFVAGLEAFGQGRNIVLGQNNGYPSYLAGTLPKTTSGVYQKLKIEVFGGNWHNSNLGDVTYYISSRDGIKINREVRGGAVSRYELRIFDNGTAYDFVIKISGDWPSIYVRSVKISGNNLPADVDITNYDTTGKTDITSEVIVNTIFTTDNSGNVGIGTTTPDSELTVKGTIHTQEVKVDLAGAVAPDFVFEEDYSLPGLAETAEYIKVNKHLPGIPSAAEMEENGLDLKEMNLKLLQKVEELTLYLIKTTEMNIQQQKEIDYLKSKIDD